jgi:poly(3-hydroxybutyrate) depolymerase
MLVVLGDFAAFAWSWLTAILCVWQKKSPDRSYGIYWRRPGARQSAWLATVALLTLLMPAELHAADGSDPAVADPAVALPFTVGEASPGHPVLTSDGLYVPANLDAARQVGILVALHGYAGSGPAIAQRLQSCADQYGWIIVAPTMVYRDYFDPEQLRTDAQQNLPIVNDLIQQVRDATSGLDLAPKLFVYGFSRGAQMADRFTMVYPREIAAVAALSAGSYTLPDSQDAAHRPMRFPFGVSDLQAISDAAFDQQAFSQVPFWVGVGAQDINPDDTSRAWDTYEGQTRIDRARVFAGSLQQRGGSVELHIFGGAGHEETATMRLSACAFLASHAS